MSTVVSDVVVCTGCGREAELLTDGRLAYVLGYLGDTDLVWREGMGYGSICPSHDRHKDDTCATDLWWPGEGPVVEDRGFESYAAPILSEAP